MLEGELLAEMTGMDASLQDLLFQTGAPLLCFFGVSKHLRELRVAPKTHLSNETTSAKGRRVASAATIRNPTAGEPTRGGTDGCRAE